MALNEAETRALAGIAHRLELGDPRLAQVLREGTARLGSARTTVTGRLGGRPGPSASEPARPVGMPQSVFPSPSLSRVRLGAAAALWVMAAVVMMWFPRGGDTGNLTSWAIVLTLLVGSALAVTRSGPFGYVARAERDRYRRPAGARIADR